MSANEMTASGDLRKHPLGLYALFGTEMWERFSFYSMLALFTLYLQDPVEGFGWTPAQATTLYANYLMFVYASPLIGGWLADKVLGYRKAVMIGGFFFMAGHGLLSIPAMWAVYLALTCLVIGNGFFKPNVSTMVGNLYPEGSHLKDRAYNIFYMGINIGAFMAPVVMEIVKAKFGFHAAFAVAAFGMVVSVAILWWFKNEVEDPDALALRQNGTQLADAAATAVDAPPHGVSSQDEGDEAGLPAADDGTPKSNLIDSVPDFKRVGALIVIFLIVIVFWMVFHQNGSTLTYWANDNTDWNVSGIISNAINPFWVVTLTFPLIWFWKFLDDRGKEPSTPAKMGFGMLLVAISFFFLAYAATRGESQQVDSTMFGNGSFRVNERVLGYLKDEGVPEDTLNKVKEAKNPDGKNAILEVKFAKDETGTGEQKFTEALSKVVSAEEVETHKSAFLTKSYQFQVSPFWLIFAYAIVTLGELMLSPMGLSLVSKVAPVRMRGLLMGGWFVATAIGNKLTMIGIYWSIWKQSSFFLVLGLFAFVMAIVLAILLKPLKKAMPGV